MRSPATVRIAVTVEVLYFAAVRDLLGRSTEQLVLPAGIATVAALARHLSQKHPELEGRLDGVRFAVNEAFAEATTPLSDGDTIAVIPPVSGG